MELFNNKCGLT